MAFVSLEKDYWDKIALSNGMSDDHLTEEMKDESKSLAATCGIAGLVALYSDDKDVQYCGKQLKQTASDLVDNIMFPDMINRYCELVDRIGGIIDDLEQFDEKALANYVKEELESAKTIYDDWNLFGKFATM